MEAWRCDNPSARVLIEDGAVEILDLTCWRRLCLENRLAREFVQALEGKHITALPLLAALQTLSEPAHGIVFGLLETGRLQPWTASTLWPVPPSQLWLELTTQCNERCVHCYADSGPQHRQYLDRNLALRVVEEAAEMGFDRIQFTGGDPLLHPSLIELVAAAADNGIPTREVYTNGLLLRGNRLDSLLRIGTRFAISFYSHNPDTHDRITGVSGSHQLTLGAIRRLVEANAPLRIGVVAMDQNRGDLRDTLDFLESHGVSRARVTIDRLHPVGRGNDRGASEGNGPVDDLNLHELGVPAAHSAQPRHAQRPERGKLMVAPDGTAFPCIFQRWLALGNLHFETLDDVYRRRPGPGIEEPARAFELCCDKIACADCRLTAYLGTRKRVPESCHLPSQP